MATKRTGAQAPARPVDPTTLAVVYRKTAELIPAQKNPRTHSEEQIRQLMRIIREIRWTNPILLDEDSQIIAGHGRLEAAKRLRMESVPTIPLHGLTDEEKKALLLADNQLALNAGWDFDMLRDVLNDLGAADFDLSMLGWSDDELAALLADRSEGLTDPDDAPAAPDRPVSRRGDVWLLGRHRLACGDATNLIDVARALNDVKPHLMVTDPPYGVDYDPAWRNRALRSDGSRYGARATGTVTNDEQADWRAAWALFPGDVIYVWHAGTQAHTVAQSLIATRFAIRAQIIWVKQRLVIGRGDYHHQHEPLLYAQREDAQDDHWRFVPEHEVADYAVRQGAVGHYVGGRKQSTVWNIEHLKSDTGHGTQKPVECMRRPIENNSNAGQAIYDPFVGSGTSIIAAEITGRHCHAIEISEAYCDVATLRWQSFRGKDAILESTGKTYAQMAEERAETTEPAA